MIALSPSFMAFNNISKLLSLVFFKSFNLSPSRIDEKYYKDLGEEGKVKNDAVFHEYKLKKQKEFLSEFRALASTDVSWVSSSSHCEIKIHDCVVAFFYGT
jgi:hypothetical protein